MKNEANRLMGSRLSVMTMVALSVSLIVPTIDMSHASSDTPSSHAVVPAEVPASDASESAIPAGRRKFDDVGDGYHAEAITALHDLGVFDETECGDSSFCPNDPLKRWEMAVWLVRILLNDETELPSMEESRFEDVDAASPWAPFVESLANRGITVGCEAGKRKFCPHNTVTRMQMATFLVRTFKLPDAASMGFTDVSAGVHKPAVDTLAALQITDGCDTRPLRYCPGDEISKEQMATFLARTLGLVNLPDETLPVYASVSAGDFYSCGVRTDGTVSCWGVNDKGQVDALPQVFSSVSAGSAHTCAIQADTPEEDTTDQDTNTTTSPISGPVKCWGANSDKQTEAPQGEFSSVSAGSAHTCAIQADTPEEDTTDQDTNTTTSPISGPVKCWGANSDKQTEAPQGEFLSVSAGSRHSCAIQAVTPEEDTTDEDTTTIPPISGPVKCWGANNKGQTNTPKGTFTAVSSGHSHSCGIQAVTPEEDTTDEDTTTIPPISGPVKCWGANNKGQTNTPKGTFTAVSSGHSHSCGIQANESIVCWGLNDRRTIEPTGAFKSVSVGNEHSCGVRSDNGRVVCWGLNSKEVTPPPEGEFTAVSAGGRHSCGIHDDSTLTCWPDNQHGYEPPSGLYKSVSVGWKHSCGVRTNGTVDCWGGNNEGQTNTPKGEFLMVSAGGEHTCGIRTDEKVTCWGSDDHSQGKSSVPGGLFTSVSAGGYHSCGLRVDKTITCWGDDDGRADSPEGEFTAVSAGGRHSCGVRVDKTIMCWGDDDAGLIDEPSGSFESVSAANHHSCARRIDNALTCWGNNSYALPGSFTDVSAGAVLAPTGEAGSIGREGYSCAVNIDLIIACWNPYVVLSPYFVEWIG